MNYGLQHYRGIPLRLIGRNYKGKKAKRYVINDTNQNVWIPEKHLENDGTIKENEDLSYIFRKAERQLELAGIHWVVRRKSQEDEMEHFDTWALENGYD